VPDVLLVTVIPPRYHRLMAMTLRLTDEETELLRRLAEREHRSMQEVVRLAVLDRAARADHESIRDETLDWAEERYADLLDRLSR
jgi:predicted transcriptional regulator